MFGAMMSAMSMMENIAALVGVESSAAGWIVHFGISILVAMLYVGLMSNGWLARYATRPFTGAGLGVGYGILLWSAGVVFIMPIWLGLVTPATPPVPNLNWMSFVGHLIYGVFLGTLYPILLNYGQISRGMPSDTDGVLPAIETGAESESMRRINVFSAYSIRGRLKDDEIPLALVLAATAIERILIKTIAEEADIAPDHVAEFCRGGGLDSYVHTASLLGLFGEYRDLLQEIVDLRYTLVQHAPQEYLEELEEDANERRVVLDAARFIEDVSS